MTRSTTKHSPKSVKDYDEQNSEWDGGDGMHERLTLMMTTPEEKWWRKLKTRWEFIKMSASSRTLCTGQLSGEEEQDVTVPNAVLHCWVYHMKRRRWKDDKRVHKMPTQKIEISNEIW